MASPRFRVVCEGPTDVAVIRRILAGHFDDGNIEVSRLPEPTQAPLDPDNFGGWALVLRYLASSRFAEAFPFTDYIVVQIDTDRCQDFGVSTHSEGAVSLPEEIVSRVVKRLTAEIGETVWARYANRIIFAIPVDSTECWLLILHTEPGREPKTQNCLVHLNRALDKAGERHIAASAKVPGRYDGIAKEFSRSKRLAEARARSGSLRLFLESVERAVSPNG